MYRQQPQDLDSRQSSKDQAPAKTSPDDPPKKLVLALELKRLKAVSKRTFASADRMAVHKFLEAIFDQMSKWEAEDRWEEGLYSLLNSLQVLPPLRVGEAFALLIFCLAPHVNKKSRSKWSRVLRYAAAHKSENESLQKFIKRKGGINACAAEYAEDIRSNSES